MNKRPVNDTVFTVQGVNPSLNPREEANINLSAQNTGRVVCEKQHLLVCPYLHSSEQIKLLNLQKNCISKITNLEHLTSLVVLDLCDNEIDSIQGLDTLTSLRILRLANNKIRQIKNLNALTQLDVLDLNGNQISRIENFKSLIRLRVLSLANNRIEKCENLRHLQNLVELNLQGNLITSVCDLERLPIERLFLNFNKIQRYEDIRCVSKISTLKFISLEGNPLPSAASYEQIILSQSEHSAVRSDSRQPMNIDHRVNRVMRLQQNSTPTEMTHRYRDRRALDVISTPQDSMSERSDTEIDSTRSNPPPSPLDRTSSVPTQRSVGKPPQDASGSALMEIKLNSSAHERSSLAKSLVQSAIDDAFRKESIAVQLERCWPILLARMLNGKTN